LAGPGAIVACHDLSFWYGDPETTAPTVNDATFTIDEGSCALVLGRTGAGKSTLLKLLNGLVPRFSGGTMQGRVEIAGRDTRVFAPRDLAGVVGYCPQDASEAFITDQVETELAWSLEQLGIDQRVMWRRVDATASLLGLGGLLDRPITTLSMGERQRLAIGASLVAEPRVLILDEPTSMLDPLAAEDVLAAIDRLVNDLGVTVILAEHRLDRALQICDVAISIDPDGRVAVQDPSRATISAGIDTPLTRLARRVGWAEVPTSTRAARRVGEPLRTRMLEDGWSPETPAPETGPDVLVAEDLWVQRGQGFALRRVDLRLRRGEVLAVTGRNGAGKSTLLSTLAGAERPARGTVRVGGIDPHGLNGPELIAAIGWLPSNPVDLMTESRVGDELASNDADGRLAPGTTAAVLQRFGIDLPEEQHPRDLSSGERLALALAILLAHRPRVLLLDEPTVGLDYSAKDALTAWLRVLTAEGIAVMLATHDMDIVADCADRMLTLAAGSVLSIDTARTALLAARWTAPQISRAFAPLAVIRPDDIPATGAQTDPAQAKQAQVRVVQEDG
jgi:energy-coupling factor transport system ATP-binding protein